MAKVITKLGEIDETELLVVCLTEPSSPDVWVIARECKYIGLDHPQSIGEVVRRDVWVTMKCGQSAGLASGV